MAVFKPEFLNGILVPYNASIKDLRRSIESPGPNAWAAIRALAEKKEPEALEVLVELTHDKDWRFRRSAVEAIGVSILGQKASDVVCHLLDDRVNYVLRSAIEAATNLKLACAHNKIVTLIKANEENTRIIALNALENIWQLGDFDLVFDRYLNDCSIKVRKQAAFAIAKNIESRHWRLVFNAWSTDSLPRHRIWAIEILEKFGCESDLPLISNFLNDTDGHVCKAANRVIKNLGRKNRD